jgi:hypothetical protein
MIQTCLPGLKPKPPTIRSARVAAAIARRIVAAVNDDDFYWSPEDVPERIADVQREIMRCGRPAIVFLRLYSQQPFRTDGGGERVTDPYGWDGIHNHCSAIAAEIAAEEVEKAVTEYERQYGRAT